MPETPVDEPVVANTFNPLGVKGGEGGTIPAAAASSAIEDALSPGTFRFPVPVTPSMIVQSACGPLMIGTAGDLNAVRIRANQVCYVALLRFRIRNLPERQ